MTKIWKMLRQSANGQQREVWQQIRLLSGKKKKKVIEEEPEEDFSDRTSSDKDQMIELKGYTFHQV